MSILPGPEMLVAFPTEEQSERIGVWLAENGPEIGQWLTTPAGMAVGTAGLVSVAGSAFGVRVGAPALYYHSKRGLAESEAAITWGYRDMGFFDFFCRPPVLGRWSDRTRGVQLVAPTGQGKTQGLLPIIIQDLESGRDVLVVEVSGDLGTEAERHARARGADVLKVDAGDPEALAFNPLFAASNEQAAQRAAAALKSVSSESDYYSDQNVAFARHFTVIARDYKHHYGRDPNEATLYEVRNLAMKIEQLKELVGASIEKDSTGERKATIDADWLSEDSADWLEQYYLPWHPDDRKKTVSGFVAYLDNLLFEPAARQCLCPEPGREVLDLAHEVSDAGQDPAAPGESGRLIVLRFPQEVLGNLPAKAAAYWGVKTVIDATQAARSKGSSPLSIIFDELPTLVGDASASALNDFQLFVTNIRKFNCAVHVAYQGWDLLPKILNGTLQSNGRNILIGGAMGGEDAKHAQRVLGSELEEDVSEQEELGRPNRRRQRRVSVKEQNRFSVGEIQKVKLGQWWLMGLERGNLRDPVVIRVPLATLPEDEGDKDDGGGPLASGSGPDEGSGVDPQTGSGLLGGRATARQQSQNKGEAQADPTEDGDPEDGETADSDPADSDSSDEEPGDGTDPQADSMLADDNPWSSRAGSSSIHLRQGAVSNPALEDSSTGSGQTDELSINRGGGE